MVAFVSPAMLYSTEQWHSSHLSQSPSPLQSVRRPSSYSPAQQTFPDHFSSQHFGVNKEDHFSSAESSSSRGRRQREFIPEAKKDDCYWDRRRRNNEAAKRSREKRRLNDILLEGRVVELTKENWILKAQIQGVFDSYGIRASDTLSPFALDQIIASMPSTEQIISLGSRISRRDSYNVSPVSMISEPPAKRSKVEPCSKTVSPDSNWRRRETATAYEADEDVWEQRDHPTDSWGALNLTQDGETIQSRKSSESETRSSVSSSSESPRSHGRVTSPTRMLPHKLRFKHSFDENFQSEDSSN